MRLPLAILLLFGMICLPVSAQDCTPASGEPITLGAVFPQGFLLLDDSNRAYNAVLAMTEVFNQCSQGLPPVQWQLETATTYDDAVAAVETFSASGLPLVIGSGMESISNGLNDGAAQYEIVFWDVTERPRQTPSEWSFALRPGDADLGDRTAQYIQTDVVNTVLSAPLRLALVVEDTAHARNIADAVREQLGEAIVIDETTQNPAALAVQIREAHANVLLVISISQDATRLWFAMRQADANVDAWMFLAQEQLALTYRYVDDTDTAGVLIVGSQHFAVDGIAQALPPQIYAAFLEQYHHLTDDEPDTEVLSTAVGTYKLLFSVLPQAAPDITSESIRAALQNTSDTEAFNLGDALPLVVLQQQDGYCLLAPVNFATCAAPMQPFPTWRQRVLNNR
ncbi:MAG: ABC transporter substrate-binding protein [Anaerolineaceae bacterium]|nr:ABC transporter substrate-binding protein [Anaerolineaceae bacterium]